MDAEHPACVLDDLLDPEQGHVRTVCLIGYFNGFSSVMVPLRLGSMVRTTATTLAERERVHTMKHWVLRLLLIPLAGMAIANRPLAGQQLHSETRVPARKIQGRASDLLIQLSSSLESLASNITPAVVQIQVTGFGPSDRGAVTNARVIVRQHSIGSGVIVDPNGYIVTNAHVVQGAQRIRVVLPAPAAMSPVELVPVGKQQIFEATLVGVHKETDVAVLKIDGHDLPALALDRSVPVRPGELVFAVGSPEGLQNSITMGVVSSVWRQPDPDRPMIYIQTDAPINPGNSGGPLVDMNGNVIGLNAFILTEGGGSEGLGFAIPVRLVRFVYDSLRKYGHVHRVEIQAVAQTITPTLASGLGLAQNWGVVISDVTPGGPADAAGLKMQDIVLAVDGRPVLGLPGLTAALYLHPTDQLMQLEILRGSERLSLNVPVGEHHDRMDELADAADPRKNLVGRLGILAVDFNDSVRTLMPNVRIPSGILVVAEVAEFNSINAGLHTGDLIHALNRAPLGSVEQLRSALRQFKPGDAIVLQIERDGQMQYLPFEME